MYKTFVTTTDKALSHLFIHCCFKDDVFVKEEIDEAANKFVALNMHTHLNFKDEVSHYRPYLEKQKDNHAHDIFIRADGKLIRLHNNEICFVEALGDYVKFVTEQKNYLSLTTLKSIEEKLNDEMFLKVHRSYIINTKKINDIEDNTVLIGRHVIPISKAHRKTVMDRLNII